MKKRRTMTKPAKKIKKINAIPPEANTIVTYMWPEGSENPTSEYNYTPPFDITRQDLIAAYEHACELTADGEAEALVFVVHNRPDGSRTHLTGLGFSKKFIYGQECPHWSEPACPSCQNHKHN
jgi:hypothetical protein